MRRILAVFNEFNRKNGPKSAFPQGFLFSDSLLELTGTKSKKEVIHLALRKLIESEKNKILDHVNFVATYIDQPVKIEQFTPLQRDVSHER